METQAQERDDILLQAVQALAGVCDGARKLDMQGFNRNDVDFGHSLAARPWERWSHKQKLAAHTMLRKYREQLQPYGIDYNSIPVPPQEAAPVRSEGTITIRGSQLRFRPNVYPSKQIRTIVPFVWDSATKEWAYTPISRETITGILKLFQGVLLDSKAQQWLADSGKVVRASEASKENLYDFQGSALDFLVKNSSAGQGALLALAPGLGKTVVAIRAAVAAGKQRVLVVAPLSLLYNWRKEILRWDTANPTVEICHGSLPDEPESKWIVTNYDTLRRKGSSANGYDCLVVDESVLIKNRKAQRTGAVWDLVARHPQACTWLLSGAPCTRFYDDLWSQFRSFCPRRFRSYWRFAERYTVVEQDQWGTSITANKQGAAEELKHDLADIFLSKRQEDVLDLPAFLFEDVAVVLSEKQSRLYKQMEDTFITSLSELPGDTLVAPNILAQMTRLLQLASNPALVGGEGESAKMAYILEAVQEGLLPKPLIVWTNYIESARLLAEELRKSQRVAVLTGQTKPEERQQIVDTFQGGDLDVLVAHPAVGKFGLTLTRAHTAIYMERSFNGDDYYQSLYRVRRIGTTSSPHIIHLLAVTARGRETVDHVVGRVLTGRYNSVQELTAAMDKMQAGSQPLTVGNLLEEMRHEV